MKSCDIKQLAVAEEKVMKVICKRESILFSEIYEELSQYHLGT
jgi:predicted transcriptional regulator